ncbi:MFS transporter [Paenibacillus lemnae]|uniref:MFS transporter n=1 Tax=Paenibacillus lemnae TaxID=1330551 RepID=A0A848M8C8_PAELE|nr:MFS transporter [Paenibacillus lemnae]NMO95774.1 MFS transporter [Paenibacillus lemnae]
MIFKNRNFLLLFSGRILTNIGDSLYAVAAMWLVYDLGGSTLYSGLAGFLSIIPRVIQLLTGPVIDRVPLRGMLVVTQLLQALLLLTVPAAYYLDMLTVGLVLVITPILTTLNMWIYPAQMAALPKILTRDQLTQGNSLFTVAYQGIDIACNAISGGLIILLGAVSLYFWNAAGFFVGALLFTQLSITSSVLNSDNNVTKTSIKAGSEKRTRLYFNEIKEGLAFLLATPLARIQVGMIVINAAGGATFTLLPAFGESLGGAGMYGMMLMAQAAGSLLGAMLTPYLKLERIPIGLMFGTSFILSGAAWGASMFAPFNWMILMMYGLAWIPGGVTNVMVNTVLQKAVPQKKLGTVFAAASAISGIAMPAGSLLGGALGTIASSFYIIAGCGFTVLIVGVYWMLNPVTKGLPSSRDISESWFVLPGTKEELSQDPASSSSLSSPSA